MKFNEINFKDQLDLFGDTLVSEIVSRMRGAGSYKSGKTASNIYYESNPLDFTLFGPSYLKAIEEGRGPTVNRSAQTPTLREKIRAWLSYLSVSGDISRDSLAYLIARKIHKEGSKRYREGTDSRILKDTITPRRIEALLASFGTEFLTTATSELVRELKKA